MVSVPNFDKYAEKSRREDTVCVEIHDFVGLFQRCQLDMLHSVEWEML
jgi:hypothetical protein